MVRLAKCLNRTPVEYSDLVSRCNEDIASTSAIASSSDSSAKSSAPTSKTKVNIRYRAFGLLTTLQADFLKSIIPTKDKIKHLTEPSSKSTGITMSHCVASHTVYCDASLLSRPSDCNVFVLIQLEGYVQTCKGTSVSCMQKRMQKPKIKYPNSYPRRIHDLLLFSKTYPRLIQYDIQTVTNDLSKQLASTSCPFKLVLPRGGDQRASQR